MNLNKEKRYLLALSGGVDSTYLFHRLISEGYDFCVCHINHHTRGIENTLEHDFCQKLCDDFKVDFFSFDFHYQTGNFHQVARDFRLEKYRELIVKNNLKGVLLAHHLDDVVENILMEPLGLRSKLIQAEIEFGDIKVYRPLLDVFKTEIIDYMTSNMYSYCTDSSNKSTKYKRNLVRSMIDLTKAQKLAVIDAEKLRLKPIEFKKYLDVNMLKNSSDPSFTLYNFIKCFYQGKISYRQIAMILKSDLSKNKYFMLSNDVYLDLSYGYLVVVKNESFSQVTKVLKEHNCYNGINFNYSKNCDNLKIACAKNYKFVTKNGFRKKMSRELIDLKVPKYMRDYYPVIINEDNEVIEVPKFFRRKDDISR